MGFFKSGKYILIERKSTDFNGTGWQWNVQLKMFQSIKKNMVLVINAASFK
jgi:hypothetical protein